MRLIELCLTFRLWRTNQLTLMWGRYESDPEVVFIRGTKRWWRFRLTTYHASTSISPTTFVDVQKASQSPLSSGFSPSVSGSPPSRGGSGGY